MLTFWQRDSLERVHGVAETWSRELLALGHRVVRLKIETHLPTTRPSDGAMAPQEDASERSANCYFECHLKLLLAEEPDDDLRQWIADQGAHLSRNARKRRDDGQHERFVTARVFEVSPEIARRRFAALEQTLRDAGAKILEVESESCVYDSALALDAGWLPERVKG
jgi:hypothetical protein